MQPKRLEIEKWKALLVAVLFNKKGASHGTAPQQQGPGLKDVGHASDLLHPAPYPDEE